MLFSKIEINGADTHPVYRFLRTHSKLFNAQTKEAEYIPWSWSKFIVDGDGQVVSFHEPQENPLSFVPKIEELLNKEPKL